MGNSINASGFGGYKGGGNVGGSSGGNSGRGGAFSPNAPIINTSAGQTQEKPKNIIKVISEIQSLFVLENKMSHEIPGEFLTLENSIDLFNVGARSGLNEGLLLMLLLPAVDFYLIPFVLKSPSLPLKIVCGSIPYFTLIINTFLCAYISRYYVGNITRKAINSFLMGRIIVLMVKSFLIYVFYEILTGMSTPERVWSVAQHAKKNAAAVYAGYMTILPHIMPIAIRCSLLILAAAILPYGAVLTRDAWKQYKIKQNLEKVTGQRR
jgi:hypothetical protein